VRKSFFENRFNRTGKILSQNFLIQTEIIFDFGTPLSIIVAVPN